MPEKEMSAAEAIGALRSVVAWTKALNKLGPVLDKVAKAEREIAHLKTQKELLEAEVSEMDVQIEASRASQILEGLKEEYKAEQKQHRQRISSFEAEFEQRRTVMEKQLQSGKQKLESDISSLSNRKKELAGIHSSLLDQVETLRSQEEELRERIDVLRSSARELAGV